MTSSWKAFAAGEETAVRQYRVYALDHAGKIAFPPQEIECVDDASAIQVASTIASEADCEIWEGARLVAHIERGQQGPTIKGPEKRTD